MQTPPRRPESVQPDMFALNAYFQDASVTPDCQFFHEMVEPTVAEFMADKSDLRRGLLACLMVAAMTEHYFQEHPELGTGEPAKAKFKGDIRRPAPAGNAALGWIADVANGTKHVAARPKKEGSSRIGYSDTQVHEMGAFGTRRAGWPFRGEEVLVGPNREWRLSQLIESAMDFWRAKLGIGTVNASS